MSTGPRWPLDRVKSLVGEGKYFVQRTRALDLFPSQEEGRRTARDTLLTLNLSRFAHTVELTYDVADVYGVLLDGRGWYPKITIDEDVPEVAVISFHPLERPLRTRGGVVTP